MHSNINRKFRNRTKWDQVVKKMMSDIPRPTNMSLFEHYLKASRSRLSNLPVRRLELLDAPRKLTFRRSFMLRVAINTKAPISTGFPNRKGHARSTRNLRRRTRYIFEEADFTTFDKLITRSHRQRLITMLKRDKII